jgi:predicted metalloprotease
VGTKDGQREFTEEEQKLAQFSSQVLASTEDIWAEVFKKMGRTYQNPKMVLYTGSVQTACGQGSASVGPFYCSGDQTLYIDLSFFTTMRKQLGIKNKGDLDFAFAYVIAHEVGHHVEQQLGILQRAHQQMQSTNKTAANQISVRLELLADYYAGVWGHYESATFQSIDENDLEEAIETAKVIGDNYLQERAQGYSSPESFTHGTSAQRMRWLKRGLQTGDMNTTTFTGNYEDL